MTTKLNVNRFFDGVFNRPSSCKSSAKCTDVNSDTIAPVFNAQGLPFVCQHHIVPPISVLLSTSSPSAIPRLVISTFVWIAINAVPDRRSITHVLQKRFERITPPRAYLNTLRAISLVVVIINVVASRQHCTPRSVCKRRGFTMRDWAFAVQCVSKTSAACTAFTAKTATEYSAQSPTAASTVPHSATLLIQPCIVENGPSTKDFPRQILYTVGWKRDRIGVSHVSVPLPDRNVVRAASQLELRCRSLLLQNQLAA
jgi:hypothetical protein